MGFELAELNEFKNNKWKIMQKRPCDCKNNRWFDKPDSWECAFCGKITAKTLFEEEDYNRRHLLKERMADLEREI